MTRPCLVTVLESNSQKKIFQDGVWNLSSYVEPQMFLSAGRRFYIYFEFLSLQCWRLSITSLVPEKMASKVLSSHGLLWCTNCGSVCIPMTFPVGLSHFCSMQCIVLFFGLYIIIIVYDLVVQEITNNVLYVSQYFAGFQEWTAFYIIKRCFFLLHCCIRLFLIELIAINLKILLVVMQGDLCRKFATSCFIFIFYIHLVWLYIIYQTNFSWHVGPSPWVESYLISILSRSAHGILSVRSTFTSMILRFIMFHCC